MAAIRQPIVRVAGQYRDGFLGDALCARKFRAYRIRRARRAVIIEVEKVQRHSVTLEIQRLLVCPITDIGTGTCELKQSFPVPTNKHRWNNQELTAWQCGLI
jgi:hypothetical protein